MYVCVHLFCHTAKLLYGLCILCLPFSYLLYAGWCVCGYVLCKHDQLCQAVECLPDCCMCTGWYITPGYIIDKQWLAMSWLIGMFILYLLEMCHPCYILWLFPRLAARLSFVPVKAKMFLSVNILLLLSWVLACKFYDSALFSPTFRLILCSLKHTRTHSITVPLQKSTSHLCSQIWMVYFGLAFAATLPRETPVPASWGEW